MKVTETDKARGGAKEGLTESLDRLTEYLSRAKSPEGEEDMPRSR